MVFKTVFLGPILHFWGFGEELKSLDSKLRKFQALLNDAERRIFDKNANKWMEDIRELAYDIEDILDEMNTERLRLERAANNKAVNRDFSICFDTTVESAQKIYFSTAMKRKIDVVLHRLDELAEEADTLGLKMEIEGVSSMPYQTRLAPEMAPLVDESEVYGREKDKESLIELLLASSGSSKKNYSVIPIVGMGGIGKTTLARSVFQDKRVKNHFDLHSWACVSKVFNIVKVAKELIKCVTGENRSNMSFLALRCCLQDIVRDKRCLIVLDDLWTMQEWEELQGAFNCCANGSMILITTRSRTLSNVISDRGPYELGVLEDKTCWELFKEKAFRGVDTCIDVTLEKIGKEILKKCKGVPLSVKVVGAIVQGAGKERWESIEKIEFWQTLDGDNDGIFPALKVSYHYLPSHLKRCFEYLSLFPSDYVFQKGELVRLWIAEGLVEVKKGKLLKEIGSEYYEELQRRSLIQKDNKMHDLVYNLACLVSRKFYCRLPNGTEKCKGNIRHFSFLAQHIKVADLEMLLNSKNLRTVLQFQYAPSALWDRFSDWTVLRVLDLSYTAQIELPSSISKLKHLRYLNLSCNYGMKNLPDPVCELYNLQVLNLYGCENFNTLPGDIGDLQSLCELHLVRTSISSLPHSIGKLHNLQVLNLEGCRSLSHLPEDIRYLRNLRELLLGLTPISILPESICMLYSLQVLDLTACENIAQLPKDIGYLEGLKKLNFHCTKILSLPDSIVKITGLQTIGCCIGGCHGDPVTLPPHFGKLINLQTLEEYVVTKETEQGIGELKDMNDLRGRFVISNMENVDSVEQALMTDLKSKKHIEQITFQWSPLLPENNDIGDISLAARDGEVEVKVLEALQPHPATLTSLSLKNYSGGRLPDWMSVVWFSSLKRLEMEGLNNVSRVVGIELPTLKELEIYKCPRLRDVSMVVPEMKYLKVENCRELIKLSLIPSLQDSNSNFSSWLDLPQLEHLKISNCPSFRNITMVVPMLAKLQVKGCSRLNITFPLVPCLLELELESLPYLTSLSDLRNSRVQGLGSVIPLLPQLTLLQRLSIEKCGQLRSLAMGGPPTPTLRDLRISKCQKLESLFEDVVLAGLESLTIMGCPKIKSIPDGVNKLVSLRKLEIDGFPHPQLLPDHHGGFPAALATLRIIGCPTLTSLPKACHLTSLTYLCVYFCHQLVSFSEEGLPPVLTDLWIGFCPKLRYLPKNLYNLKSLQKLRIVKCPLLEGRPEDQLPPKLEQLYISECPKLTRKFQEDDRTYWFELMEHSYVDY